MLLCYAKVRNCSLGREGLARCDSRFKEDMDRKCNEEQSTPRRIACKGAATVYYRFVREYSRRVNI
ncbi:phospholipase A2 [Scytonema sp. PCC 10023]|uniref:phospholipase A2 n=1 Tax=Scytonema sp. PCC 10023 TaxID=1680591 RepID=UPI0039C60620